MRKRPVYRGWTNEEEECEFRLKIYPDGRMQEIKIDNSGIASVVTISVIGVVNPLNVELFLKKKGVITRAKFMKAVKQIERLVKQMK